MAPLKHTYIIIGMLWRRQFDPIISYTINTITFTHKQREVVIKVGKEGNSIPIVNHIAIKRHSRQATQCYFILARDKKTDITKITSKEDLQYRNFLQKYTSIFIDDLPTKLPPKRPEDHKIDLIPGNAPPIKAPYRTSQAQQNEIMNQVNELLQAGLIRPSSSPFGSPVLLVHKKDGSFRMCVDYKALNKITIKSQFPIPRINNIFDRLYVEPHCFQEST